MTSEMVAGAAPSEHSPEPPSSGVAYASLRARLRALATDAAVVASGIVIVVLLTMVTENVPGSGRIAVAALIALIVLYEPVMVWRFGGTVGHLRANLHVVDEGTGRNAGFTRAFVRFLIKGFFGVISVVTMGVTRRHQAIHDGFTNTTVRIRDLATADPLDVRWERAATATELLPSRARRAVVIAVYVVVTFLALGSATGRVLSPACLRRERCSSAEQLMKNGLDALWISATAIVIVVGWSGRLWGCRARPPAVAVPPTVAPKP